MVKSPSPVSFSCRSLGVHPGLAGQDHGHPTHCSCTLHPMCLHLGPDAPWSGSGAIPCRTTFLGPLLCSRSPLASPHSKTSQRAESFFGTKGVITPDEGLGEHQPHSGPSERGEHCRSVSGITKCLRNVPSLTSASQARLDPLGKDLLSLVLPGLPSF